jgi:exodeoxyribonuclease-3
MDFLLLNPRLAPRLAAAGVDADYRGRERASDHAPTWIVLREPAKAGRATARAVKSASKRPRKT